jgi:hypothetical protein
MVLEVLHQKSEEKKLILIHTGPVLTQPDIPLHSLKPTLQNKTDILCSKTCFRVGNLTEEKSYIQWDLRYGDFRFHRKLKIKSNDFLMTVSRSPDDVTPKMFYTDNTRRRICDTIFAMVNIWLNMENCVRLIAVMCSVWFCWSLTLREEHRLRAFENRALRRIFGPKRHEVTGGWRKLLNEELHNLYPSPRLSRMIKSRMRWPGHVVRLGEKTNAYRILAGKPEEKRPLERRRRRWLDNIKIDLTERWGKR